MRFPKNCITLLFAILFIGCEEEVPPTAPFSITTSTISQITTTTAVGGGNVLEDGGSAITEKGIVWGTQIQPTVSLSTKTIEGQGPGAFTSKLSSLQLATLYYVRAYATNNVGTSYGEEVTFSTSANLASIAVNTKSDITYTSASVQSNISADGGAAILTRGVVWGTQPNPTISLDTKTTDGAGTGSFTSALSGLSKATKYYLRAYATNSAGTAYSAETNFTTASLVRLKEIKRGTVTHEFQYDNHLRLRKRIITVSTLPNFIDSLTLTYSSGKGIIKEYDSDLGLYLVQDHTLNTEGYSISYNQSMFNPNDFVLLYDVNNYLNNLKSGSQNRYTFTYQQGNMATFKYPLGSNDDNYTFEYYMDKNNTLEIGYGMDEDLYNSGFYLNHHPLFGKANKNLIKKSTIAPPPGFSSTKPPIKEFSYEFDQDGDVKAITITVKQLDGTVVSSGTVTYKKYYF